MIRLERLTRADWDAVKEIYAQGIATGEATFETSTPGWEAWDRGHLSVGRLVAKREEAVVGWAALGPYSGRAAYAGVAEASIYVALQHRGRGIGSALMEALVAASEEHGIWTLQGGVFPENEASIALCKRAGFREVGTRKRIGKLHGVWRDVLLLERRSATVGID